MSGNRRSGPHSSTTIHFNSLLAFLMAVLAYYVQYTVLKNSLDTCEAEHSGNETLSIADPFQAALEQTFDETFQMLNKTLLDGNHTSLTLVDGNYTLELSLPGDAKESAEEVAYLLDHYARIVEQSRNRLPKASGYLGQDWRGDLVRRHYDEWKTPENCETKYNFYSVDPTNKSPSICYEIYLLTNGEPADYHHDGYIAAFHLELAEAPVFGNPRGDTAPGFSDRVDGVTVTRRAHTNWLQDLGRNNELENPEKGQQIQLFHSEPIIIKDINDKVESIKLSMIGKLYKSANEPLSELFTVDFVITETPNTRAIFDAYRTYGEEALFMTGKEVPLGFRGGLIVHDIADYNSPGLVTECLAQDAIPPGTPPGTKEEATNAYICIVIPLLLRTWYQHIESKRAEPARKASAPSSAPINQRRKKQHKEKSPKSNTCTTYKDGTGFVPGIHDQPYRPEDFRGGGLRRQPTQMDRTWSKDPKALEAAEKERNRLIQNAKARSALVDLASGPTEHNTERTFHLNKLGNKTTTSTTSYTPGSSHKSSVRSKTTESKQVDNSWIQAAKEEPSVAQCCAAFMAALSSCTKSCTGCTKCKSRKKRPQQSHANALSVPSSAGPNSARAAKRPNAPKKTSAGFSFELGLWNRICNSDPSAYYELGLRLLENNECDLRFLQNRVCGFKSLDDFKYHVLDVAQVSFRAGEHKFKFAVWLPNLYRLAKAAYENSSLECGSPVVAFSERLQTYLDSIKGCCESLDCRNCCTTNASDGPPRRVPEQQSDRPVNEGNKTLTAYNGAAKKPQRPKEPRPPAPPKKDGMNEVQRQIAAMKAKRGNR